MTFDLDAFIAEGEHTGEPFVFVFGGEKWEWPGYIDLRVSLALERGDLEGALVSLFGPEQWPRFQALDVRFDNTAWRELARQHAAHIGTSLGESSASSGSSKSTAGPSKRTSQSTTTVR